MPAGKKWLADAASRAAFYWRIAVLADRLLAGQRPWLNRLSTVFVLIMGLWYLPRGLAA